MRDGVKLTGIAAGLLLWSLLITGLEQCEYRLTRSSLTMRQVWP